MLNDEATLGTRSAERRGLPSGGVGFRALVAFGVASALVIAAGWLAGEVLEGDTAAFDRTILLWFRVSGDPSRLVGPAWLAEMLRDVTSLGSTVVLGTLVVVVAAYLWLARRRADCLLLSAASMFGQAVSTMSKMSFARARPDLVPGAPQVFTASFPSGHALLSAVVFLTLGALLARAEVQPALKRFHVAVAVLLTVAIGASRVALGVHWPTDVLAGWCVGAACALVCSEGDGWLRRGAPASKHKGADKPS